MGFFAIPAAGLGFFFSAWLTMIFWGIVAPDIGVAKISYTTAMAGDHRPLARGCSSDCRFREKDKGSLNEARAIAIQQPSARSAANPA